MAQYGSVQRATRVAACARALLLAAATLLGAADPSRGEPASLANRVTFSPSRIVLDNPASPGATRAPASFTVDVRAHDAAGNPIEPSETRPLMIEVQGGAEGTITPRRVRLTAGSAVTFQYDGSYFADPLTLVAWLGDGGPASASDGAPSDHDDAGDAASAGTPLGRAPVLQANAVACTRGTGRYTLRVLCDDDGDSVEQCALNAIRHGLRVRAAVGWDDATGHLVPFAVDTGSIGTVVPKKHLGKDAIGPGAPGRVYYDSSGRIYSGHYYLAPVSFELEDGRIVKTAPMLVLGIDRLSCVEGHPRCRPDDDPDLHYLGVGFARPGSSADGFASPTDNAFLRLAEASGGDVTPGYVLTGRVITIGVPSDGYALQALAPSTTTPGDWSPPRGCFAFPDLPGSNPFCGNFLLDVGLPEMFLDLPSNQRPAGSAETVRCRGGSEDSRCAYIPDGVRVRVLAGSPDAPDMSYEFTTGGDPRGPAPLYAQWIDRTQTFINVGRRPLFRFHYLFDARCGNVGFLRVD